MKITLIKINFVFHKSYIYIYVWSPFFGFASSKDQKRTPLEKNSFFIFSDFGKVGQGDQQKNDDDEEESSLED